MRAFVPDAAAGAPGQNADFVSDPARSGALPALRR